MHPKSVFMTLLIRVYANVFQNAEIFREKKISQAAYVEFHSILNQDPRDFWAGTSFEG